MMEEKTVTFAFSSQNYIDSHTVLWSTYFARISKIYAVWSLLPFIIIMVYAFSKDNPLALVFAIGLTIYAVLKWVNLFRSKRRYMDNVLANADRIEQNNKQITYSFTDEWLEYRDSEKKLAYSWSTYTSFEETDSCLLIKLMGEDDPQFIIARSDIGDEDYDEIAELLKQKLEPES